MVLNMKINKYYPPYFEKGDMGTIITFVFEPLPKETTSRILKEKFSKLFLEYFGLKK